MLTTPTITRIKRTHLSDLHHSKQTLFPSPFAALQFYIPPAFPLPFPETAMAINQLLLEKLFLLVLLLVLMTIDISATSYGSVPSTAPHEPKPQEKISRTMGVQGVVYCRTGSQVTPLQGAAVRVTCLAVDEHGYESAPFSLWSEATDENGYFLATLELAELEGIGKLSGCKAFLDYSPSETCKVPTDINKGMTGCVPQFVRHLVDNKMNLYTVGPFVYEQELPGY